METNERWLQFAAINSKDNVAKTVLKIPADLELTVDQEIDVNIEGHNYHVVAIARPRALVIPILCAGPTPIVIRKSCRPEDARVNASLRAFALQNVFAVVGCERCTLPWILFKIMDRNSK